MRPKIMPSMIKMIKKVQ